MTTHSSSSLEDTMGRGAWWASVNGAAKSGTRLKCLSRCTCAQYPDQVYLVYDLWTLPQVLAYVIVCDYRTQIQLHSEYESGERESEVAQLCPTLCDPMDCSLPGSSLYGIFQARILEWVAISFSRRSSQPRD